MHFRYFSERGDAVAKASKETHVVSDSTFVLLRIKILSGGHERSVMPWFTLQMDYRSMVHDRDEAIYAEIRVIILDIRGFYVSLSMPTTCGLPYCWDPTR